MLRTERQYHIPQIQLKIMRSCVGFYITMQGRPADRFLIVISEVAALLQLLHKGSMSFGISRSVESRSCAAGRQAFSMLAMA